MLLGASGVATVVGESNGGDPALAGCLAWLQLFTAALQLIEKAFTPLVNNLEGSESQLCKAHTVSARCVSRSHCEDADLERSFLVVV